MTRNVEIIERDRGLRALVRRVNEGRGLVVEIGVLGAKGAAPKRARSKSKKKGAKRAKRATPATLVEVASFNEFGTDRIPARSFIGAWFEANKAQNKAFARELAKQRLDGRINAEQSLVLMGLRAQSGIQKRIADGVPPPNAPSTIARKKSSKPLVDTGQLRSSISFRVGEP